MPLAVSILISSDFLQMQRLVEECLRFVGEHLTEIVKLPIDLSCLGDKMVLQLAKVLLVTDLLSLPVFAGLCGGIFRAVNYRGVFCLHHTHQPIAVVFYMEPRYLFRRRK